MLPVKLLVALTILSCTLSSNLWALREKQQFGPTELWDHPWTVEVQIKVPFVHNGYIVYHCVAALVHEFAVLTSGGCLNRTDPLSSKTKVDIHADALDYSGRATEEQIYAMVNVTYHNFEKKYDLKKFDYGLVLLCDRIIYDLRNNNKRGKVIPIAKYTDIPDIDFNDCILTSISIWHSYKIQVKLACMLTSFLLTCNPINKDEPVQYDSGSPVSCKRLRSRDPVLVGLISKYSQLTVDGKYVLMPQYTSLVQLGHNLTYNGIHSYIDKEYHLPK